MSSSIPWLAFATAGLILTSGGLYRRFRAAERHHKLCVQLCHRIADELSRRQDEELVVDRVFDVVIEHTRAAIGILLWRGEHEHAPLMVLRVRGLSPDLLPPGTELPAGARGFGFGMLDVSGGGEIIRAGLREAVHAFTGIRLTPRQNMMCIPVTAPPATHGLIQLVSSDGCPYSEQTLADVCGLGVYLDAAIQNAQKIETIYRQRDAAEALYKIGLTISRSLGIDEILTHAVEETRRLMRATFTVYVDCPSEAGLVGTVRSAAGDYPPQFAHGAAVRLDGRMRELLDRSTTPLERQHVLVRDLRRGLGEGLGATTLDPDDAPFCAVDVHASLMQSGIRSAVVTPVGESEDARGLLCSFSDRADFFDAFHVQLQRRIANQLLIALNSADHHQNAKRLALSEERRRMSDDLHDNMAQVINGLSLELHSLIKRAGREHASGLLLERMHAIRARLEESKATIREAIFELQIPEENGLWTNLRDFAARFEQWHGFPVTVHLPEQHLALPPSQQREVLRIVQEALWNARRHSGAKKANLRGSRGDDGTLHIEIEDHGHGYAEGELETGQGIATMHSRARRLGGALVIEAAVPRGVRVFLEFPSHAS